MNSGMLRGLLALLNALGIVGVGTMISGRIKTGCIQTAIAFGTLALTVFPIYKVVNSSRLPDQSLLEWYRAAMDGRSDISLEMLQPLGWTFLGMFIFAVNLLWSLTTTGPLPSKPSVTSTAGTPPPLPTRKTLD